MKFSEVRSPLSLPLTHFLAAMMIGIFQQIRRSIGNAALAFRFFVMLPNPQPLRIRSTDLYLSEAAIESLKQAALELQAHHPDRSPETIEKALTTWLECAVESLAEDALWHLHEGSGNAVMMRSTFRRALYRSNPIQVLCS